MRAVLVSFMLFGVAACVPMQSNPRPSQSRELESDLSRADSLEMFERLTLAKQDAVEAYLSRGGDPNVIFQSVPIHSQMQASLLSLALMHKQFSTAWLLLEFGAKPNALKGETHEFPLWWAASSGNLEITKALVKRGATIDAQMWGNGTTALHAAIYFDHPEIVRFLIDSGADVTKRTTTNNPWSIPDATPLELARKLGRQECERELMRKVQ